MALKIRLTPQARQDAIEIWRYTEREWGTAQAETYSDRLAGAFDKIAENPFLGRPRDEVRPGYRSVLAGKHVIFYRPDAEIVEVARILHANMDVLSHLGDDES